jgi:thiopeptide-type bacteriocin biosynthesis protein
MTDSRDESRPLTDWVTSGFFAFRTPLLPFDALRAWGEGLGAAGASEADLERVLARDRAVLRERLRRWVADPVVREALFIASPVLEESLGVWEAEPESERGQKVERTLVRYLARMAGRATPFGLFAGHSVGRFAEHTRLRIAERSAVRRHTRLDMDYLCALVEQVRRLPEVRGALRYVPNSSLYRAAGRWRYLEMRVHEHKRSYHLVGVEPSPYLEATLERARGGALVEELAAALVAGDAEVSLEEAREYVEALVAEQLLVPTWAPSITGLEPVPHLLEQARAIPSLAEVRQRLSAAHEALARMDASPPGHSPESYREVVRGLEALPTPVGRDHLFQVDTFRPAPEATLSSCVVEELLRAVQVLRSLGAQKKPDETLALFRARFLQRYEGRAVPLLEALDEECGVGFVQSKAPGGGTGPLLDGFVFPRHPLGPVSWEPRFLYLLRRLESVWRTQARDLVLTPEDLEAMRVAQPPRLPEALGMLATVVARSSEAVDRGEFQVLVENLHGPSGALYLGRFCHGDAELEGLVREHLRAEEALRPDAIFAEVVHLPQERMGNVICRPLLRRHDLVFLGESGAADSERIPLTDLWVSVEGERIVLRSRRLGREVIPRMSNAHNYRAPGLGAYRFLCMLQNPHGGGLRFDWGPLTEATFLPRVVHGRAILALARWRLEARTLQEWGKARGAERFAAVQRFRAQARLPRWVCLSDGDNQLPVDLDNALSVETFVHLLKGRASAVLEELLSGPDELCVESREGQYVHELVVPFVRQAPPVLPVRPAPPPVTLRSSSPRCFPPGSEWLYLKLYGGAATLDRLLGSTLGDTLRQVVGSGAVERWFFLRYEDPDEHLRLRFQGSPARLEAEVWPAVRAACRASLEEGTGWRVQLDTYEREVERYGGPAGIELAEELFTADSEAVLDILQSSPGDEGAEVRWRLALKGLDALLEDLGLTLEGKLVVLERLRADFGAEFRVDKGFEAQLGLRYRRESRKLEALLAASSPMPGPMEEGARALQRRGARLRPVVERLRQAEREGRLSCSVEQLAGSFLHMHVNRMLPRDPRAQELILYDFLVRLYRSRLARMKKGS